MSVSSRAGSRPLSRGNSWAVVLAGGQGTRMRESIRAWLGEERPKQYCAFVGTRTMLEHTGARAAAAVGPDRVITVIGPGQSAYLSPRSPLPGSLVEQRADRGTAFALLLATAHVLARDPDASIVLFPADHFVRPEGVFVRHVRHALDLARLHADRALLLGAAPDRAETDFGWIEPADLFALRASAATVAPMPVCAFNEKPTRREAERLHRRGALWNTMVLTARGETLWALGREGLGASMEPFEALRHDLTKSFSGRAGGEMEDGCASLYDRVPSMDLSREVLARSVPRLLTLPLHAVEWSDWGRPERVDSSLRRLGLAPIFDPRRVSRMPETARDEEPLAVAAASS